MWIQSCDSIPNQTDPNLPNVIEYLNRPQLVRDYYDLQKIIETVIDINDTRGENLGQYFPQLVDLMCKGRHEGQRILVHCDAGMSRSVCAVAALMLWDQFQLFSKAKSAQVPPDGLIQSVLDHIKSCRPIIAPNEEFVRQLRVYYLSLTAQ